MTGRWVAIIRRAASSFLSALSRQARRRRWCVFRIWAGRRWRACWTGLQAWQTLVGALVAFGALYWGSYLARADNARAGRERCEAVEQGLKTEVELMEAEANGLMPVIKVKFSLPNMRHEVFPPPYDESIHAQEPDLLLLDGPTQDIVLRSEYAYRGMRLVFTGVEKIQAFGPGATSDGSDDAANFIDSATIVATLTADAARKLGDTHECARRNRASLF